MDDTLDLMSIMVVKGRTRRPASVDCAAARGEVAMAAVMRFRLLGPVEVVVGAHPVPVRRPRQRAILAYLLLHANRVVSTDRLIDALWGDNGPATARAQVQTDLSIVRRALRDAASDPVVTRPAGYLIEVGPGQLDADEFTAGVARAAAGAGRADAVTSLRKALALWRGPAIADVSAAYAEAFREGLQEQRLRAYEKMFALEIDDGHHDAVVADLVALLDAHPLHERFAAQLMLALYRGGRAAEALQVARMLRHTLADQHGIDPGPELCELETRILRHDTSLRPPPPAAAVRLAQLPPDVADFVGRDEQLAVLDGLLTGGPAVVAIVGGAGVGKTALALRWAHRVADRFPDGQLYIDMRGYTADLPLPPIDALGRILRTLGVDPARIPTELDEAAAAYRTVLADRRVLVVVDNACDADQVRPLLPAAPGCACVVTSRQRMGGLVAMDAAEPVTLDVLPAGAALDMLTRILGAGRLAAEPRAATDLADACGHLPLALRIASAQLAIDPRQPIADLLPRLAPGERLPALSIAGDRRTSVATAFSHSYHRLSPASRRAFGLLGVVPCADVATPEVAALLSAAPEDATSALRELETSSLIAQRAGRFVMHDLIREYAATTIAPDDAKAGVDRWLSWMLHSADAAVTRISIPPVRLPLPAATGPHAEFADARDALDWLDAERVNLIGAIRLAAANGRPSYAWLIADMLCGYFRRGRHTGDWISAAETALHASRLAAPDVQLRVAAITRLSLGLAYQAIDRAPDAVAHFTAARHLADAAGWGDVAASAVGNLGLMAWRAGDRPEAGAFMEEAVTLARRAGNVGVEANILRSLAILHRESGRLAEAVDTNLKLVPLFRRIGSREGVAHALGHLADDCRLLGRLDDALRYALESAREYRAIGNACEAALYEDVAEVHERGGAGFAATAMAIARRVSQPGHG